MFALGGARQDVSGDRRDPGFSLGHVKTHLDAARQKLHCKNLRHAAAVAFATGLISASGLEIEAVTALSRLARRGLYRRVLPTS